MKRFWALLCALTLVLSLLPGCQPDDHGEDTLNITASTYPVYLLTCAVTYGVDGVRVDRLSTGSVSCLHDYTLSVTDMKKIDRSDVLALNGVDLEEFMSDALALSQAAVIDCSAGVALLSTAGEDSDHDHEHEHAQEETDDHGHDHGEWDPHIWLDPANAATMADNLAAGLAQADPANARTYLDNAAAVRTALLAERDALAAAFAQTGQHLDLITFHDGFAYFAHAFDLHLLRAIEEEAGSEASAREIVEVTALVKEHSLPVIFTEVNGSDATAKAITRETGCSIAQLSMVMDGPDVAAGDTIPVILSCYIDALRANAASIIGGFAAKEVS